MVRAIKGQAFFLLPFLAWMIIGGWIMFSSDQVELHMRINRMHQDWLDPFFKYVTYLGDGVFAAFIVLLGLIYKLRYGVIGLASLLGASAITQVLKRQVYSDHFRPVKLLEHIPDLHLIEGVSMHTHHSFPSGHATAALMTFFFLSLLLRDRWAQLICFVFGWLAAFSRVYISQHFFEDVYIGSLIGLVTTFIFYHLLHDQRWGEKGLIDLIGKR